jgi:hypothetical protein
MLLHGIYMPSSSLSSAMRVFDGEVCNHLPEWFCLCFPSTDEKRQTLQRRDGKILVRSSSLANGRRQMSDGQRGYNGRILRSYGQTIGQSSNLKDPSRSSESLAA